MNASCGYAWNIAPWVTFRNKAAIPDWVKNLPQNGSIMVSDKGWTTDAMYQNCLRSLLIPAMNSQVRLRLSGVCTVPCISQNKVLSLDTVGGCSGSVVANQAIITGIPWEKQVQKMPKAGSYPDCANVFKCGHCAHNRPRSALKPTSYPASQFLTNAGQKW